MIATINFLDLVAGGMLCAAAGFIAGCILCLYIVQRWKHRHLPASGK